MWKRLTTITVLLSTSVWTSGQAQNAGTFTATDAILDTAIPFAIGAHEAEQQLRSSFGWATFQEGLVEGVYYRFDPDGYARFAPTPRLDEDSFEVVCSPVTLICAARKETLDLELTQQGQLQISVRGLHPDDIFFLVDEEGELPLPNRILEPLDVRFEALLASGGDLVIRRQGELQQRLSLTGFAAVAGYLKWVAAGQDHAVLPADWPVPNARPRQPGQLTNFDRLADHGADLRPQEDTWTLLQQQRNARGTGAMPSQVAQLPVQMPVQTPVQTPLAEPQMAQDGGPGMLSQIVDAAEQVAAQAQPMLDAAAQDQPLQPQMVEASDWVLRRMDGLEQKVQNLQVDMMEMRAATREAQLIAAQAQSLVQGASGGLDGARLERLTERMIHLEALLERNATQSAGGQVAASTVDARHSPVQPSGQNLAMRWPDLAQPAASLPSVTQPTTPIATATQPADLSGADMLGVMPKAGAKTAQPMPPSAPTAMAQPDSLEQLVEQRVRAALAAQQQMGGQADGSQGQVLGENADMQSSDVRLRRGLVEDILAELDKPVAAPDPAPEEPVTQPEQPEDTEFLTLSDYISRILEREAQTQQAMTVPEVQNGG